MPKGRSTKCTPAIVQEICSVIAITGSDKQAYEYVGVGETTFYRWLSSEKKEFREFREAVINARAEHHRSQSPHRIRKAQQALQNALEHGVTVVTTTEEQGESGHGPFTKTVTRTVNKGVPRWAIEQVLGPPRDEFQALAVLVRAGWLPISILKFTDDEFSSLKDRFQQIFEGILPEGLGNAESVQGITEETVDEIKHRILYDA